MASEVLKRALEMEQPASGQNTAATDLASLARQFRKIGPSFTL